MKKIFIISLLFIPVIVFAQDYLPLVPCGLTDNGPLPRCTLCHFFEMLRRVYQFILFMVIPPLAALIIAIGGFMYIVGGTGRGGPELISQAKKLFVAVAIGMVIAYGSWVIINLFLEILGFSGTWHTIICN